MVLFRWFHRIDGAPPDTLPSFDYEAPEEVCGDRKRFDSPIKNEALNKSLMLIVEGPKHSAAQLRQPPLAAPRWRCIHYIFTSCNIQFSI